MKIRIIKNTDRVWYAKHIDAEFEVVRVEQTKEPYGRLFWVREPDTEYNTANWVKEWDAKVIEE